MRLSDCLNIADLRRLARRRAHRMVFDYIDGGADDEWTLAENVAAFDRIALAHKVLVGVERVDTRTRFLGHDLAVPFFCSPTAGNRLFHTRGERAVAAAAAHLGTAYCLSTLSSVSIEDVAAIHPGPRFFQLYVWKDRGLVKEMLARARAAGYAALILTVDLPVHGNRERDPRNGFTIPPKMSPRAILAALQAPAWTWDYLTGPRIRYANLSADTAAMSLADFVAAQLSPGYDWAEAEWLLGEWGGPPILKGVVRADDARRALASGFAALMLSNHGGRQLDGDVSPVAALPAVRDAVGSDAELVVDGGIRRGTHILKALALGANAVSFGRPYLYGLAAGGDAGAAHALAILRSELERAMALAGTPTIADIGPDLLSAC